MHMAEAWWRWVSGWQQQVRWAHRSCRTQKDDHALARARARVAEVIEVEWQLSFSLLPAPNAE